MLNAKVEGTADWQPNWLAHCIGSKTLCKVLQVRWLNQWEEAAKVKKWRGKSQALERNST